MEARRTDGARDSAGDRLNETALGIRRDKRSLRPALASNEIGLCREE